MTIQEKADWLKNELDKALHDERYAQLLRIPAGNLSRNNRVFLSRHTEHIDRLNKKIKLCLRNIRIVNGEIFTLDDVNECRLEIMQQYPAYDKPIDAQSGIIFAVEAIRKSFGKKYATLYKHPIRIDFGTGEIYEISPGNFIRYYPKEKQAE